MDWSGVDGTERRKEEGGEQRGGGRGEGRRWEERGRGGCEGGTALAQQSHYFEKEKELCTLQAAWKKQEGASPSETSFLYSTKAGWAHKARLDF